MKSRNNKLGTVFKNTPKCLIRFFLFWHLSTQNVNVARFARNVECDFFCDFQTLCVELTNRKRDQGVLAFLADAPPVDAVVSAIRKRRISLNLIRGLSSTLSSLNWISFLFFCLLSFFKTYLQLQLKLRFER